MSLIPDYQESVKALLLSIKKDLESLLNSRKPMLSWGDGFEQLETSLLNYGMTDFVGSNIDSQTGRERICEALKKAIHHSEPRLIEVDVVENIEQTKQDSTTLYYRVEARLLVEPEPQQVSFDSIFDLQSNTFTISG